MRTIFAYIFVPVLAVFMVLATWNFGATSIFGAFLAAQESDNCPPGMYGLAVDNLGGLRRIEPAWTGANESEDGLKEFSDRLDAIGKWAADLEDACEREAYLSVVGAQRRNIARYRGALTLESTMTKPPTF